MSLGAIFGGLAFEFYGAQVHLWWSEPLVDVFVAFIFLRFLLRPPKLGAAEVSRVTLLSCIFLATAGELVLSALWGLYHYRVSVLPLFVPPGHVLLFLSGLAIAQSRRSNWAVLSVVPILAFIFFLRAQGRGQDFLSLPLFIAFVLCLRFGPEKKLYAVMFTLALALEFYGTALGTWVWSPGIPFTPFFSANPPLASGVFYALLDLLTRLTEYGVNRMRLPLLKLVPVPTGRRP